MLRRRRKQREKFVSAKELAEMGFCEKRVLLAHRYGRRMTPEQQRKAEWGRRAHQRYYREGLAAAEATDLDRRCFVATLLFGDGAWKTVVLRRYRDTVVLHHWLGRWRVFVYYRFAPSVCRALSRLPWLQPACRLVVDVLARAACRQGRGPM